MWIYIVWYLYRAMRNVYQQRRGITVGKVLRDRLRLFLRRPDGADLDRRCYSAMTCA